MGGYGGLMSRRHPGWKALVEAVAPGARVTRLRRLTGGGGGTDAYDVTLDQAPRRVVVKLYPDGDGTASSEWSRLECAQRVTAAMPEPIAADLSANSPVGHTRRTQARRQSKRRAKNSTNSGPEPTQDRQLVSLPARKQDDYQSLVFALLSGNRSSRPVSSCLR